MQVIDGVPIVAPENTTGVTRILIPAGIGDTYWIMVKMQSFLEKNKLHKPVIIVLSESNSYDLARIRSVPFLKMIPFVTIGDPEWITVDPVNPRSVELQNIYDESRIKYGRSIFPGFMGYEYFISYNGWINTGHLLEDDDIECDWYFPINDISGTQKITKEQTIKNFGRYAIFYFSNFTNSIIKRFSIDKIIETSILLKNKSLATETLKRLESVNPDNQKIKEYSAEIEKLVIES